MYCLVLQRIPIRIFRNGFTWDSKINLLSPYGLLVEVVFIRKYTFTCV